MSLKHRLRQLAERLGAAEDRAPTALIYLPDNGRGDLFGPLPYRTGCVVIHDPDDPPPELKAVGLQEGMRDAAEPTRPGGAGGG